MLSILAYFGSLVEVSILIDPITGLPVLSGGPDAAVLSSKQVEEILANFP